MESADRRSIAWPLLKLLLLDVLVVGVALAWGWPLEGSVVLVLLVFTPYYVYRIVRRSASLPPRTQSR